MALYDYETKGNIYSRYHAQDKTLRNDAAFYTDMRIFGKEDLCEIKLLGTMEESNISVNSDDFIFVLVRNFMDTSTVEKSCTESLGSLFVDIDNDYLYCSTITEAKTSM